MSEKEIQLPAGLISLIKGTPVSRTVAHCRSGFEVPFFDIYAKCPQCGTKIKVRSFSANQEVEDVFDAVFEWSLKPGANATMQKRIAEIAHDLEN